MVRKAVTLLIVLAVLSVTAYPQIIRADKPKPAADLKGRIFVSVQTAVNAVGETNPFRNCVILAVDPDTGASKTVAREATNPWGAADGKTMAYNTVDSIRVRMKDGSTRTLSENEPRVGAPVISTDGTEVICSIRRPASKERPRMFKTWRYPVVGGEPTKIPVPDTDGVCDWSPDKRWLLTLRSSKGGGALQLYVMRPDGTGQRRLSDGTGVVSTARFSPDGKRIVYMHQDGTKNALWVMDAADGQHRTKIVDYSPDWHPWACWSPDGKRLAVVDWNPRTNTGYRLDVMDADGRNRRTLKLPKALWMSAPDWR